VTAGEVETVSGPSLTVALRDAECDRAQPGVNVCRLELPAAGQILRRLSVEIAAEGPVGYRLDQPRDARWLPLAEGVWQREGLHTSHHLPGSPEPVAGATLRLELYGTGEAAPRLVSYGAELALPTLLFHAGEPGRYTLAYGGAAQASAERAELDGLDGDADLDAAAWLEAGPEREHPLTPLPASATAPGTALKEAGFAAGWQVLAPDAKPGDLVRLELPNAVYAAARPDLGDLRLAVGGRQIPFYLGSPAPPVPLVEERGLKPGSRERSRDESEIEIRLPEPGLPLTELYLTLPGMPLRRTVGVRYLEPAPPGARKRERSAVARQTWECVPEPPLPCRVRLPLSGPATALLSVRFHDGDNPPLPGLQATVWRRGDVLLFVWPAAAEGAESAEGETPVRLLAGREGLTAPSYDLAALGESLLGRPWQPAELDLEGAASPEAPWWSRWILPITLGIAGIFLVLLLRRILTEA
jgi:hypothetical protein